MNVAIGFELDLKNKSLLTIIKEYLQLRSYNKLLVRQARQLGSAEEIYRVMVEPYLTEELI